MTISVVMPAYNAEKYIEQSIKSVLEQTYEDYELIIVDDCSTDRTAEIVNKLAESDDRIIFLQVKTHLGVSAARNLAVSRASGDWIAFLDSDDIWTPDKLEKQLRYIAENPQAALTYTASAFVDDNGNPYSYVMHAQPQITHREILHRNLISCSSVVVKKTLMQKYPFGDPQMCEDTAAWLQMLREVPCAHGIDEPLLIYRLARKSRSSNRVKAAKRLYLTYRYVGYRAMRSAWLVFRYTFYSVRKRHRIRNSA